MRQSQIIPTQLGMIMVDVRWVWVQGSFPHPRSALTWAINFNPHTCPRTHIISLREAGTLEYKNVNSQTQWRIFNHSLWKCVTRDIKPFILVTFYELISNFPVLCFSLSLCCCSSHKSSFLKFNSITKTNFSIESAK